MQVYRFISREGKSLQLNTLNPSFSILSCPIQLLDCHCLSKVLVIPTVALATAMQFELNSKKFQAWSTQFDHVFH